MTHRGFVLLLLPGLWLTVFLLVPTAVVAASAFSSDGLKTLTDPVTLKLFWRSFWISFVVTAMCLLAGYPAAYFVAGCSSRRRNLLLFLIVLPFWTNLLVRTYALTFLLRPLGLLYTETAVVLGLAHSYLPFMILPIYASIEKVPPRLLEASRDLGASPWSTFLRVTVPLTMPGIAAGCILVFIPVLGSFATPELLGGARVTMLGSQINLHFQKNTNTGAGSALTLVLMLFTLALMALYYRFRKTEDLL